jgi:hypothetical protein
MAFGQQSGPPATARQVQELLALLHDAGHVDFRDARGPMGFTQRQAAGKFTRDEATAFIAQLQEAESGGDPAPAPPRSTTRSSTRSTTRSSTTSSAVDQALRQATPEQLAAELQRRGWVVLEP